MTNCRVVLLIYWDGKKTGNIILAIISCLCAVLLSVMLLTDTHNCAVISIIKIIEQQNTSFTFCALLSVIPGKHSTFWVMTTSPSTPQVPCSVQFRDFVGPTHLLQLRKSCLLISWLVEWGVVGAGTHFNVWGQNKGYSELHQEQIEHSAAHKNTMQPSLSYGDFKTLITMQKSIK